MARYTGPATKKSRRLGVDLKGGDKNFDKRPYPPGDHGRGRVKEVFFQGRGESCLVNFFDAGDRLRRREDFELGEHGWLSMPLFHGEKKRFRHDDALRKVLHAQQNRAWGIASKEQLALLEGLTSSDPV